MDLEEEANVEQLKSFSVKITTPKQYDCLFRLMREDKDIAKGIQLTGRALLRCKWQNYANELNKLGPHRDRDGWANVWSRLKCKIRRKLANNDHNFDSKDERVIEILGCKEIMNQRKKAAAAVRKKHRFNSHEQGIIKLLGWKADDDVSSQENSVVENYVDAPPSNRVNYTRTTVEGYPSIHQQKLTSMRQQNDKDTTMMRLFKAKAGLFSITRSIIVLEKETVERTQYMQKSAEVKDEKIRSKLKLIELQTDIASRKLLQMDKTNCQCAAREQKMDNVDNRDEKGKVIEDEVVDIIQNQDINSPVQPVDSDFQSVSEKNFSDDTSCIKLEPDTKNGFLQIDASDDTKCIKFEPSDEHGFFPNDDESDNRDGFVKNQRFVQKTAKAPTLTNEKIRSKKRKFE